ncbi:hypothetical protein [Pseudoxanthomonas mexicana]
MKLFALFSALSLSLTSLTASAATQQPREEMSRWGQIVSATWPLAQANVGLCGSVTGPVLGYMQVGSRSIVAIPFQTKTARPLPGCLLTT